LEKERSRSLVSSRSRRSSAWETLRDSFIFTKRGMMAGGGVGRGSDVSDATAKMKQQESLEQLEAIRVEVENEKQKPSWCCGLCGPRATDGLSDKPNTA
jgi:hypothetical protein